MSALIDAVKRHDEPAAIALLASGSDPNEQDRMGATPLHWAAMSLQRDLVRLLLEAGANSGIEDDSGLTAMDAAVSAGDTQLAHELAEAAVSRWSVQDLCARGEFPFSTFTDFQAALAARKVRLVLHPTTPLSEITSLVYWFSKSHQKVYTRIAAVPLWVSAIAFIAAAVMGGVERLWWLAAVPLVAVACELSAAAHIYRRFWTWFMLDCLLLTLIYAVCGSRDPAGAAIGIAFACSWAAALCKRWYKSWTLTRLAARHESLLCLLYSTWRLFVLPRSCRMPMLHSQLLPPLVYPDGNPPPVY